MKNKTLDLDSGIYVMHIKQRKIRSLKKKIMNLKASKGLSQG